MAGKSSTKVVLLLVVAAALITAGILLDVNTYLRGLLDWVREQGILGVIVFAGRLHHGDGTVHSGLDSHARRRLRVRSRVGNALRVGRLDDWRDGCIPRRTIPREGLGRVEGEGNARFSRRSTPRWVTRGGRSSG